MYYKLYCCVVLIYIYILYSSIDKGLVVATDICTERGTRLTRREHRKKIKKLLDTTRSLDNSIK